MPPETPKKRTRIKKEERHIPLDPREGDDSDTEKKSPLGKFSPIIMPLILALAVSYLMINVMAVPKGTYNNAVAGLSSRVASIEESIDEVETLTASIQDLREELSSYSPSTVDQGKLDNLATKVNSLEAQVAGLDTASQDNLTDIMDNQFAIYEDRFDSIEEELTALQPENGGEDEPVVAAETTRWTFRSPTTDPSYSFLDFDIDCDKVEEEGLYEIELVIDNISDTLGATDPNYNKSADLTNAILNLVLQPREYTPIDEEQTYLDSDDAPWLSWDTDFVIKTREGQEICRRITFTSEKHNLGTLAPGQSIQLDLILELYYK